MQSCHTHKITATPLGAGQDVGRSCILVSVGGKNIMFDCGMHMGYNDHRRFPDFSYISKTNQFDTIIDCVIISHFHLDHCGALPHFTEQLGYNGPLLMTYPTKAICPILLEDYRKITVERKGEKNFFTSEMITTCMSKVRAMNVHETVVLGKGFTVKAYYAGHVLGAGMFEVCVNGQRVVYTGDYNMTPDRHLGSAWLDRTCPDLLITETTYATLVRDSKRLREQNFLNSVKACVENGGKVLIPVFALGRAQELCILIDSFWSRMGLNVPVYFSAGLTTRANQYYKCFINWTNQKIKHTFLQQGKNQFDFTHIKEFDRSYIKREGPMVVFATPGMLHAGLSLDIFKEWCGDERNLCIMPGYCVAGTVGNKVLSGQKEIVTPDKETLTVRCKIAHLSFSAHADAKGITQLIQQCCPTNVMLVHGEKEKMKVLKDSIESKFGIPCHYPANGCTARMDAKLHVPLIVSRGIATQFHHTLVEQHTERLAHTHNPLQLPCSPTLPSSALTSQSVNSKKRGRTVMEGGSNSSQMISQDAASVPSRQVVPGVSHPNTLIGTNTLTEAAMPRELLSASLAGTLPGTSIARPTAAAEAVVDGVVVAQPAGRGASCLSLMTKEEAGALLGLHPHTLKFESTQRIEFGIEAFGRWPPSSYDSLAVATHLLRTLARTLEQDVSEAVALVTTIEAKQAVGEAYLARDNESVGSSKRPMKDLLTGAGCLQSRSVVIRVQSCEEMSEPSTAKRKWRAILSLLWESADDQLCSQILSIINRCFELAC